MNKVGLLVRTHLMSGENNIVVYGKDSCPWTIKQKESLDGAKTPYDYVDCSKKECPDFVKAFPTTIVTGFWK